MAYLTKRKRNREDLIQSEDSLSFALNKYDKLCPFSLEVKREIISERSVLLNHIKNNRLTKKEKIFLELSIEGRCREFIQNELNLGYANFYATKRRVIKKVRKFINEKIK